MMTFSCRILTTTTEQAMQKRCMEETTIIIQDILEDMIQAAVEDMNPAAVQALEMTQIMESTALSDL